MIKKYLIGITILFILFGGLGGLYAWYDVTLNARQKSQGMVQFSVTDGAGGFVIAKGLEKEGIIKNAWVFFTYVRLNDLTLQAGDYEFSRSASTKEIAQTIAEGKILTRRITVKEGWTISQIESYFYEKKIFTKDEFEKALGEKYGYLFLAGGTGRDSLEGYLFPDTYNIRTEATAAEVVDMMLKNMDKHLAPEILDGFRKQGLTSSQGVIMASIVELEGQKKEDREMVAGILLKRLKSDMRLEADATVRYVISNWNKKLTVDDLNVDSPYNTRLNMGLPPGAICNPGLDSMAAVARPKTSDYLYYLSEKNGTMHYARTLDEHNANIAKYLNY